MARNGQNPPTLAQYEAGQRRKGTPDWSAEDRRVEAEYLAYHNTAEVQPSPGNSSSASASSSETTSGSRPNDATGPSPAPTTGGRSRRARTAPSSASSTAGNGRRARSSKG